MKTFDELDKGDQKLICELMNAMCCGKILDINDPILTNMSFKAKEVAITILSETLPLE